MLSKEALDELEALLAKATGGEWFRTGPLSEEESCRNGGVPAGLISVLRGDDPEEIDLLDELGADNIDLIAALRNAAPALIAAARRVGVLEKALEPFITEFKEAVPGRLHDKDWNPDYHVEGSMSIAEIQRADIALKGATREA